MIHAERIVSLGSVYLCVFGKTCYFFYDLYFKAPRTLMHMQSEKGSVAMMRRMETRASNRAQHPGPSGSAAKRESKCSGIIHKINYRWCCKRSFQ
jgi:hypothetical protein